MHVQAFGVGVAMAAICATGSAQDAVRVQTFPLTDTKALALNGVKVARRLRSLRPLAEPG